MKTCNCCKVEKELGEFYHRKSGKPFPICKICQKDRANKYYANNPEKVRTRTAKYFEKNKEERMLKQREYDKRPERILKEKMRKSSPAYRSWENKYRKDRKQSDIEFRLSVALRNRISMFFRNKTNKPGSAIRDLGCSVNELRSYLESKFTPEMNWDNYGSYWHIDHIKALANFTLTDVEQFKQACHYTNLQPLEAGKNIRKSNK